MAARPRRSVAGNTSYQISFPALPGSSDEESGAEDDEQQPDGKEQQDGEADGTPAAANDEDDDDAIEIDSSGSEYAPVVVKDKDGTLVEVQGSDEDDATDLEDVEDEDDDDDDSAAGEKELDDISIATSAGLSEDSEAGGQGLKHGRIKSLKDAPTMRVVGRTPMAMLGNYTGIPKKAGPRRSTALVSGRGAASKTPWYDLSYAQSFLPPRFTLTHPWNDPIHCPESKESGGLEAKPDFNEESAHKMVKRNAYLPFGPHWSVCEDHGYYKGKFERSTSPSGGEEVYKAKRWGGWYEDLALDQTAYSVVNDIRWDNAKKYEPF